MKRAKGSAVPRVVRGFWSLIFLAGLLAPAGAATMHHSLIGIRPSSR